MSDILQSAPARRGFGAREIGLAILACVVLALTAFLPQMLSGYYLYLANMACVYLVLALGMNILMGDAGLFAFSHVAFYGIGIYFTGYLTTNYGLDILLGMAASGVLAGVMGLVIGYVSIRLKDVYLALSTFAFAQAMHWVFQNWKSVTGGPNGMRISPAEVFGWQMTNDSQAFYFTLPFAFVAVLITLWLAGTRLGRSMRAMRESEPAAMAIGVNVTRVKALAFAVSAVYAAVAGGLFTAFSSYVGPSGLDFHLTVTIVTMLVVGGIATIPGTVIGVIVIALLNEVLRNALSYQELIYGLVIILFIQFAPKGLYGLITDRLARRRQR